MPRTKRADSSGFERPSKRGGSSRSKGKAPADSSESGMSLKVPAFENPNFLVQRFQNHDEAATFASRLALLPVLIEREFNLESFNPNSGIAGIPPNFYHWITSRGWQGLLSGHVCYPDIVREFYFRARFVSANDNPLSSIPMHPDMVVSFVRDVEVSISAASIREFYGLPTVPNSYLPRDATALPSIDEVANVVVGFGRSWGAPTFIPAGFLKLDLRVLLRLYHHCIRQDAHHTEIRKSDPWFFYVVGSDLPLDLGAFLFAEIDRCSTRVRTSRGLKVSLMLGSLISRMLLAKGVPLTVEDVPSACPLNKFSMMNITKSLAQAPVYAPASRARDDPYLQFQRGVVIGSKGAATQGPSIRSSRRASSSSDSDISLQSLHKMLKTIMYKQDVQGRETRFAVNTLGTRISHLEEHAGLQSSSDNILPIYSDEGDVFDSDFELLDSDEEDGGPAADD